MDPTALSYWFPLIEAAGVPVPRTITVPMPLSAQQDIWAAFDGKDGGGGAQPFFAAIGEAGRGSRPSLLFADGSHVGQAHQARRIVRCNPGLSFGASE